MLKKWITVACGAAIMAFGIDVFLIPAKIAAGGVSGIAAILKNAAGIKASVTTLALNFPLLLIFGFVYGKKSGLSSLVGALMLSFFLEVFSFVPRLVQNEMLCAIAGGLLSGAGLGTVFRADANTGGTDIVALLLQKKWPYFPIGTLVLVSDGIIILASGLVFKSFDIMIYACIALFISTKVIDAIVIGLDYAKEITVVSPKAPDIAREVMAVLSRGVTGIRSIGLYSGKESLMLISVVSRNQAVKFKNIVQKYDENAFVIVSDVKEVIGEGFR